MPAKVIPYEPSVVFDWGKFDSLGVDTILDAGYVPPAPVPGAPQLAVQTPAQRARHHRIVQAARPILLAPLEEPKMGERAGITNAASKIIRDRLRQEPEGSLTKQLCEQAKNPNHLPTYYQQTGSCVGNGADLATILTIAIEVAVNGEAEKFTLTFMPYIYGRSRSHAGMGRSRGQGSFGTAAGEAAKEDGTIRVDFEGLPEPTYRGGLSWGSRVEMDWSAGDRIGAQYLGEGRIHPIQEISLVTSTDAARDHIRSGKTLTIASMWGGMMNPPVKGSGKDAVLLNRRSGRWAHQMECDDWWWHPVLGVLFRIRNSWSETAHGDPPNDIDPPGSFWIPEDDMGWILSQEDSVVFAGHVGYPDESGAPFDWSKFDHLGINRRKRPA